MSMDDMSSSSTNLRMRSRSTVPMVSWMSLRTWTVTACAMAGGSFDVAYLVRAIMTYSK